MTIQSVQRALHILSLFSMKRNSFALSEISLLMNLPKTTAHGLLKTLLGENFLRQDPVTKKYSLGMKIHELGSILSADIHINRVGAGPAKRLAEETGGIVCLGVWDQNSVLVTSIYAPDSLSKEVDRLEPRLPAHCTGLGKAMLSILPEKNYLDFLEKEKFLPFTPNTQTDKSFFMEEIKQVQFGGFATESEEFKEGLACIAAPVRDRRGGCAGAISLSNDQEMLSAKNREKNIEKLLASALEISKLMGYSS